MSAKSKRDKPSPFLEALMKETTQASPRKSLRGLQRCQREFTKTHIPAFRVYIPEPVRSSRRRYTFMNSLQTACPHRARGLALPFLLIASTYTSQPSSSDRLNSKLGGLLAYLRTLPLAKDVTAGKWRFHLAHAVPGGNLEGPLITPDIPDSDLSRLISGIEADVICCGHTHLPMIRTLGEKIFLNPGSVGFPLDGDHRASYAVWHDGAVNIRRAEYDVNVTARELSRVGLSSLFCARLSEILAKGLASERPNYP